jgi:hypothetical protein
MMLKVMQSCLPSNSTTTHKMIQLPNTAGTGINCGTASVFVNSTPSYTLSCWIRRQGAGTTISTGTGGITAGEPIFTAGMAESDTIGLNCVWFLGYIAATNKIQCDFEDLNTGLNHPSTASTTVFSNFTDYHIALVYNYSSSLNTGSYKLYINGALDNTSYVWSTNDKYRSPDTSSRQLVGIGVGITSNGTRNGAFNGLISDVAMWNAPLNDDEIALLAASKVKGTPMQIRPQLLKAYWPLNETSDGATAPTAKFSIRDMSGNNRHGSAYGTIIGKAENVLSYL